MTNVLPSDTTFMNSAMQFGVRTAALTAAASVWKGRGLTSDVLRCAREFEAYLNGESDE